MSDWTIKTHTGSKILNFDPKKESKILNKKKY